MSNPEEEDQDIRVTIEVAVLPEEEGNSAIPVLDEAAASELVNLLSSTAENLQISDPLSDRLDPLIGLRQELSAREEEVPIESDLDATALTSVQPILSSIRDLRSALHDRVINLGMEVEGLRARASIVERGFAESRRRRGEERTTASLLDAPEPGTTPSRNSNRWQWVDSPAHLSSGPTDSDGTEASASRDAIGGEERTYDIVKGSGSAEIEGTKEERRERRSQQLKLANMKAESKASLDAIRQRVRRTMNDPGQPPNPATPSTLNQVSADTLRAASRRSFASELFPAGERSFSIPPVPLYSAMSRATRTPAATSSDPVDESLTTRGIRVQNGTPRTGSGSSVNLVQHQMLQNYIHSYRDAVMNRPVPSAADVGRAVRSATPRVPFPARSPNSGTLGNPPVQDLERNVDRLQRMIDDARNLQERQQTVLDAGRANINEGTRQALDAARQNVQELRDLHTLLDELYTRFDTTRTRLRAIVATDLRSELSRAVPATRESQGTLPPSLSRIASPAEGTSSSRPRSRASRPTLPRRPSPPFLRSAAHPYYRPRIGVEPIAAVINIDNLNSFELHFDGNVVFRPIARRMIDRELVARCLSMLPGGREDTPSRWMRLISDTTSRPRRAEAWGGYWIRWVSEQMFEVQQPRQRRVDTTELPKIIAYDVATTPPEDDAWVRTDETEFYTSRTRLRTHIGPWIHSRIRITPYPNDPVDAPWGTSAHVRQAIREVGRMRTGDFARFNLLDCSVTLVRAAPTPVVNSSSPATIAATEGFDTTTDAWLNAYEPALGQIVNYWVHHRNLVGGPLIWEESDETSDNANNTWGRDYLDANGVSLPTATLNRLVAMTLPE